MPNRVYKMRELCEITSSKRIYAADYKPDGVPFYRGKEISEKFKGNLDVSTELFIDRDKFEQIRHRFGAPVGGDLLLTSVGTLGSPYVVNNGEEFYFKDGNLTWFRKFNHLESRFLYYWLQSSQGKGELKKCTIGSSQSAYTIVLLKEMEITLPPLPTQRKIAAILSAYDDLIENNLRRIKILEEMAQNLYREWFVKFRFPGHEQARFVDSSLGRIPEGWEVKKLGEILELKYGKALKQENRQGGNVPVYGSSGIVGYHDVHLVNGPGIVIGRKGNVGSVYWSEKSFYPIDTAYFVSSEMPLRFLFYDLQTKNFLNNDAAVPGLNRNQAYSLETVIPTEDILRLFCGFADDFEQQAAVLRIQNTNLRRTRDMLLPKLISGEVDVSELAIAIPEEVAA
ncbi:MAG: restriction endonuclease subunit S [Chlorobium sp.]